MSGDSVNSQPRSSVAPGSFQVLHLIERLSLGGAGRALLGVAKYSLRTGRVRHTVASLLPPDATAAAAARADGIGVRQPADLRDLARQVAEADIVQVHFWNSPAVYDSLRHPWGPARVLCWSHVAGDTAPQILTKEVVGFADAVIASSPHTAQLPVFRNAPQGTMTGVVPGSPDFSRLEQVAPRSHPRFTVGYLGSVDFVKMHPDFVALHAAIDIPGLRVVVAGEGAALATLRSQAGQLGSASRFEFPGYVENIGELLSEWDVFGYPLVPDNYATSELVLQEAMFAGVPPVVWARGGPSLLVSHGQTGWVAHTAEEYRFGVEELHRDDGLRRRLGANAARFVRDNLGAERSATQMMEIYAQMLARPKRVRLWPEPPASGGKEAFSGAGRFVAALGAAAPHFRASLRGAGADGEATALAAERMIAASSPAMGGGACGGILHYRIRYPNDPCLRLWSGLFLAGQGRPAVAAGEFAAARSLGLDLPRVRRYLEGVAPGSSRVGTAQPDDRGPLNGPASRADPDPGQKHGSVPSWAIPRGGLSSVLARLKSAPGTVAYLGDSSTAQKAGFRPVLHQWLQDWSGHRHRAVNAGFGGVGSLGCVFIVKERVVDHRPDLCFVACTTGDLAGRTPLVEMGPAMEGIVHQLRNAGCAVCLVHLHDREHPLDSGDAVVSLYERVAERHAVPSLHVRTALAGRIRSGELDEERLFRDSVHLTLEGAFVVGTSIGEALAAMSELPEPPEEASKSQSSPLWPQGYLRTAILPPEAAGSTPGSEAKWGTFQLVHRYLEVGPDRPVDWHHPEGDLMGILLVLGPQDLGIVVEVDGGARCYDLRDRWSGRDRVHAFFFADPVTRGRRARLAPAAIPGSLGGSDKPSPRSLRLLGLLTRY